MATKATLPGFETIDFNLIVENGAKYFYSFKTWTPIMGALLLSGLRPTEYWCGIPDAMPVPETSPSFWVERFDRLYKGLWVTGPDCEEGIPAKNEKHLRGLDGESLMATVSPRFSDARKLLRHWDTKCEDEQDYPLELDPVKFVVWLEELCWNEEICFFDRTWLDAFLKLHGTGKKNAILPADVVASFQKVTEVGDASGWHPLSTDISEAQREAISQGMEPFAIKIVFPLIIGILEARGVIDRSDKKYVSGRAIPVKLDDGRVYVLRRDTLRVQLNRLKTKRFAPQR
ncbi:hypothetical protein [Caballeronia sp. NCTM1]|uniref:hypothetical protein n=1 Tax=Caballeronia sp. NCTM1 TaxID=2921753 RepID=UPI002027D590|nr:hypothetical protein [Caballeronia sp. NCTM1]